MNTQKIRTIFNRTFKGQGNIMTPNSFEFGKEGDYIYEVSSGKGFSNDTIYGVTFLNLDGSRIVSNDPSCCCHSMSEVKEAIKRVSKAGV